VAKFGVNSLLRYFGGHPYSRMKICVLLALFVLNTASSDTPGTLTFTHISPNKLSGIYQISPDYGLRFISTENSLFLENLQFKQLLNIFPTKSSSYELHVLEKYIPSNVTILHEVEVFLRTEAKLLPAVYHSMAALEIMGPEMPGAMGLYKIALGVQKTTSKFINPPCKCDCPSAINLQECKVAGKSLPQCCDCIGQCGACGSCWSYVCGDCCWYKGCCGHDICCYAFGSIACLFPINFSCHVPYTCSDYNTACCGQAPDGRHNTCPVESF